MANLSGYEISFRGKLFYRSPVECQGHWVEFSCDAHTDHFGFQYIYCRGWGESFVLDVRLWDVRLSSFYI